MLEITKEAPVFFVSNGPAFCLDCFSLLDEEEKSSCRPVLRNGEGNDGCGLLCDCGESWPPLSLEEGGY